MIATKDSFEPHSSEQLPNSKRLYVTGQLHPDVRVPMREIELTPTKSYTGAVEPNEPVRVYDCSGPWGDPDFKGTVEEGLPALRAKWIRARGDVEEIEGRRVTVKDDGYLSDVHAASRSGNSKFKIQNSKFERRPLRAKAGKVVTQLEYARRGIITPEMEFIAIREQMRVGQASSLSPSSDIRLSDLSKDNVRNDLNKQHAGSSQIAGALASSRRVSFLQFSRASRNASRRKSRRNLSAAKWPRPRHYSCEHQSSRKRADDHRAKFSREDQCQHRQQRRGVEHRGGSREDAVGHQVGRGHRHGSFHRQEHPRNARVDYPQLAGAHRHGADLPGARKGRMARPRN